MTMLGMLLLLLLRLDVLGADLLGESLPVQRIVWFYQNYTPNSPEVISALYKWFLSKSERFGAHMKYGWITEWKFLFWIPVGEKVYFLIPRSLLNTIMFLIISFEVCSLFVVGTYIKSRKVGLISLIIKTRKTRKKVVYTLV